MCWARGGLVSAGRVLRTEVKPGLGRGLVGEMASWGVGQRRIPGPTGEGPKVDTGQRGERWGLGRQCGAATAAGASLKGGRGTAEESPRRGGDTDLHLTRDVRVAGGHLAEVRLQGAGGGAPAWQHCGRRGGQGPLYSGIWSRSVSGGPSHSVGRSDPEQPRAQAAAPPGRPGARLEPGEAVLWVPPRLEGGVCLRREGAVCLTAPTRLVHTGLWFDTGGPPASGSTWLCTQWTGRRGPFPKSGNKKPGHVFA